MQTLMKVSCDPECGFMMQDHDEKELKKPGGKDIYREPVV